MVEFSLSVNCIVFFLKKFGLALRFSVQHNTSERLKLMCETDP